MSSNQKESGVNAGNLDQLQALRFNLSQAVSWLNNATRQLLKPYGITPKQYHLLQNLAERNQKEMTVQQLRDSMADKMSDASRLVDRLILKGYLNKTPSKTDRRSSLVNISPSGLRILKEVDRHRSAHDNIIRDRLNQGEIKQLNELLDRLK